MSYKIVDSIANDVVSSAKTLASDVTIVTAGHWECCICCIKISGRNQRTTFENVKGCLQKICKGELL